MHARRGSGDVHGSTPEVPEDREARARRVDGIDRHDPPDVTRELYGPIDVVDQDGAGPRWTVALLPGRESGYAANGDASVEQRRVPRVVPPGGPAHHVRVERGGRGRIVRHELVPDEATE